MQLDGKLFYDHTMRLLYMPRMVYKEMSLAGSHSKTVEDIRKSLLFGERK
jgi:hypothetical protein